MATGFLKKNVDYTKRNGDAPAGKTVIKYVNTQARDGISGEDSFNVQLSPNNVTFKAGSYNAIPETYYSNVYVTRGAARIKGKVLDSSITAAGGAALPAGLSVSVSSGTNGTFNTQLVITTTANLVADAGEIIIPVQYSLDTQDTSTNYIADDWNPELQSLVTYNAIYSWTLGKTGQSTFNLDLSNESATINADASGHIYENAHRPDCSALLSFGADTSLEGVYYDMSWTMAGVTGIGINHQTGRVLYDNAAHEHDSKFPAGLFDFGDASVNTVLDLTIDASYQGKKQFYKTMTITKALPGQQGPQGEKGEDSVSRWIELSADQIKIDASGNILPPKISAKKWKQVGGNNPIEDQSTNIKIRWTYDSSVISVNDPSTAYTGEITISSTWNYLTFKLYDGTTPLGETETVPILKDGKNGSAGDQGQRGAAIRGPVLWDSSLNVNVTGLATRWFYCGTQSSTNPPNPLEGQFIDVIMHNKNYYICNSNYEQPAGSNWTSTMADGKTVAQHWTVADASYNFVAANVILAQNAGIDFLTGNEIYLKDSNGEVTAGASGGNGISFWAGGEKDASANFTVNYDGTMTARKGSFGCLSIGQEEGQNIANLVGSGHLPEGDYSDIEISPFYMVLDSSTTGKSISITAADAESRYDGIIDVSCGSNDFALWTENGIVKSGSLEKQSCSTPANTLFSGGNHSSGVSKWSQGGEAVISPGLFGIEVCFISTSSANFTKSNGTWKFHGIDTRVSSTAYPEIIPYNEIGTKYHGYWAFAKKWYEDPNDTSSTVIAIDYVLSGVGTSAVTRQNNVLYITI